MSFKEELRTKTEEIEKLLTTYLPQETGFQKTVLEAVNYSVLAGGKRLRPHSDERDLSDVRRRGKGRGALHGSHGNDSYIFTGT